MVVSIGLQILSFFKGLYPKSNLSLLKKINADSYKLRSADYLASFEIDSNGSGFREIITRKNWDFVLCGIRFSTPEIYNESPSVLIEQMDVSDSRISGGESKGFIPLNIFAGGNNPYFEESKDIFRTVGESGYLKISVKNPNPNPIKISILLEGWEVKK